MIHVSFLFEWIFFLAAANFIKGISCAVDSYFYSDGESASELKPFGPTPGPSSRRGVKPFRTNAGAGGSVGMANMRELGGSSRQSFGLISLAVRVWHFSL